MTQENLGKISSFTAKIQSRKVAVLGAAVLALAPVAAQAQDIPQVAKDALAFFSADPEWKGPMSSPPIAEGKVVVDIPCMQAAIGCSRPGDAFLEAAEMLGWETHMIDGAGDPNKVQAAVKTAIQMGADGIFLPGGNLSALGDTFQQAKDAGIVMISMSGEGNIPGEGSWDANIWENTIEYAQAMAAYITAQNPEAKILVVNDAEYAEIDVQQKEFVRVIAEYCPTCEVVKEIDFSIVNIATTMPQQVKATLQANPEIDWIAGPYDFASQYIVQAVMEIGRGDDVKLVSWGGHPQNMGFIADGQVQAATVAAGMEWIGYAAADQMNRLFNGEAIWTETPHNTGTAYGSQNYAEQIVDATNLPEDISENWNGGFDFKSHYMDIWGLK